MEVPDKVGRALPAPVNATSVRAWKFTYQQVLFKHLIICIGNLFVIWCLFIGIFPLVSCPPVLLSPPSADALRQLALWVLCSPRLKNSCQFVVNFSSCIRDPQKNQSFAQGGGKFLNIFECFQTFSPVLCKRFLQRLAHLIDKNLPHFNAGDSHESHELD